MMAIPCMHPEIDTIFLGLEKRGCKSICLTSEKKQAGTTSLCIALYERYLLAGYKTLYVDLNIINPSVIASELLADLVEYKKENKIFSGIAAPVCISEQITYRDPSALKIQLTEWHKQYERVIFDTASLQQSNQKTISAFLVAAASDASILVVKGGTSTSEDVQKALVQLQSADCPFICIALNQFQLKTFSEAVVASTLVSPWLPKKLKSRIQKSMQKYALFKNVI